MLYYNFLFYQKIFQRIKKLLVNALLMEGGAKCPAKACNIKFLLNERTKQATKDPR